MDSARFICASIVAFGHLGAPWNFIFDLGLLDGALVGAAKGASNLLFNGPAAVIVFFVISGFCIHLPYVEGKALDVNSYYLKRFVRIVPPAIAAAGLVVLLEGRPESWNYTVFWSVVCEIVYYGIYPLLLFYSRSRNWAQLVLASFILAFGIAFFNQDQLSANYNNYGAFGWWTWVIGLPCWLLGCLLAEKRSQFPSVGNFQIWSVRALVFLVSVVIRYVKFNFESPFASNVITLNLFSILVFFWMGLEIAYYQKKSVNVGLELAGRWSYSLYLIHPVAPAILAVIGVSTILGDWFLYKFVIIVSAFIFAYAFFVICEKPSHRAAVFLGANIHAKGLQKKI